MNIPLEIHVLAETATLIKTGTRALSYAQNHADFLDMVETIKDRISDYETQLYVVHSTYIEQEIKQCETKK